MVEDDPGARGFPIIPGISWNVPFESWDDISIMQRSCIVREGMAILDRLVLEGHIRREMGRDGIYRYFPMRIE